MKIIRATLKEIETVSGLFDLYRQFYEQESDIKSAKEFLEERISKNESVIFIAIDEGKNFGAGFVQLYPSFSSVALKKKWILNDLYVHKDYRMKGVAEALIEKAKELARETGAKGLTLETHSLNSNAQKLYDKTGFKKDDEYYYYNFEV